LSREKAREFCRSRFLGAFTLEQLHAAGIDPLAPPAGKVRRAEETDGLARAVEFSFEAPGIPPLRRVLRYSGDAVIADGRRVSFGQEIETLGFLTEDHRVAHVAVEHGSVLWCLREAAEWLAWRIAPWPEPLAAWFLLTDEIPGFGLTHNNRDFEAACKPYRLMEFVVAPWVPPAALADLYMKARAGLFAGLGMRDRSPEERTRYVFLFVCKHAPLLLLEPAEKAARDKDLRKDGPGAAAGRRSGLSWEDLHAAWNDACTLEGEEPVGPSLPKRWAYGEAGNGRYRKAFFDAFRVYRSLLFPSVRHGGQLEAVIQGFNSADELPAETRDWLESVGLLEDKDK